MSLNEENSPLIGWNMDQSQERCEAKEQNTEEVFTIFTILSLHIAYIIIISMTAVSRIL